MSNWRIYGTVTPLLPIPEQWRMDERDECIFFGLDWIIWGISLDLEVGPTIDWWIDDSVYQGTVNSGVETLTNIETVQVSVQIKEKTLF